MLRQVLSYWAVTLNDGMFTTGFAVSVLSVCLVIVGDGFKDLIVSILLFGLKEFCDINIR